MTLRRSLFILGLSLALAAPSAARGQKGGESAGGEAEEVSLPPEEDVVDGSCRTPRHAWIQLLWWAGKKKNYVEAAKCFDTSDLERPRKQAPRLAERLLEHLDAEGRMIDTGDPASADRRYEDPRTGKHIYRAKAAPEFLVARRRNGRWLFTPASLERIPTEGLGKRLSRHLPDWFRSSFLDIEVWKLLGILLLIFVAFLVRKTTVFFFSSYVRRLVRRRGFRALRHLAERADRPIGGLSMAAVFYLGFPRLAFPAQISRIALVATEALAAFSVVWLAYRLIDVLKDWMEVKAEATATKMDDQLVPLVTKTLKIFVSVLGGIFVLQNLEIDVGSLLAGVGLGGLAFALAARDTVANFFGSLMIFVDKPFQIGDWIVVSDCEGVVEEVGFRTTRIRTFANSLVTLPNNIITSNRVDNYGARRYRRYSTTLSLTYDTPPAKVQGFCEGVRALIAATPGMRKDFYMVEFQDYGESGLHILLYCFFEVESWNEEMRARGNLNLEILRLAKELGVSFAFPTRTLHVDSLVEPGDAKPAWSGSTEPPELAAVIDAFGPGGAHSQPHGFTISSGYAPDSGRTRGSAPDEEA